MSKPPTAFDPDNEAIVKAVLRPKDAATLILVRRDKDAPRILMGQRHGNMAFMANKYVFPAAAWTPAISGLQWAGICVPMSKRG